MARRKKGEKGCEEANERWRKTMMERYGGAEGLHRKMQKMGQIGGRNGTRGGFGSNPALASIAGKKGGEKSKRTKGSIEDRLNPHKDEIAKMLDDGATYKEIAEKFNVHVSSLGVWIRRTLDA